ncbi:hypothetical protein [Vibrio sp. HN007]|uniref:hypothetical protein n=1 Tax=Vibrio iocasae TaxID=3098914 RepID=UPI0035D45F4C
MSYFRRTVLICNLLLVALLTSVFGIASSNNFVYANYKDGTEAMLKMEAPALDCQQHDELQVHTNLAWENALVVSGADTKASHSCCPSINVTTLFPATSVIEIASNQESSLLLIQNEQMRKTRSFAEKIFRPPIV